MMARSGERAGPGDYTERTISLGGSMRTQIFLAAVMAAGAAFLAPGATEAIDLGAFLAEIEDAGRPQTVARADLRVHVKQAGEEREYRGVVVHRGADVYLELQEPAARVLVCADDGGAERVHQVLGDGAKDPVRSGAQDVIGTTTLLAEDFRPFRASSLRTPQIISETKRTLLVSGAPAEASPYVLLVYLLDREKRLPTRVQYYERTLNNLVRMRRETDPVRVGGTWRPGRTEIEDYRTGAVTVLEREWVAEPNLPGDLFDPKALATRSLLRSP